MKALHIILLAAVFLLSSCNSESKKEEISVLNLRCELLTNPLGIDSQSPRLSWTIKSSQRNIQQSAYQILVASKKEYLEQDSADIWNSGIVKSENTIQVPYEGPRLPSKKQVFWKVKSWSENAESGWSEFSSWSMGLLNYKDWSGRWIGFDRAFPWDREDMFSELSARYFRKEFDSDANKEIEKATIYIIGLGNYELYLNGNKVGRQVLSPTPTDFTKNVKYNTFNVNDLIENGKNAIGTILGNGRYYTMRQHYKPYKIKTYGYPKLLLNLVIEYSDGSSETIRTDNRWKGTADGPIRSNNEYDGENYDARKEMPGWNNIGFDDRKWLQAEYVQEAEGRFEAQMNENMTIKDSLSPVSLKEIQKGTYIIDMGQNMVGWLQMKVRGRKGQTVKLRFAESLKEDGELFIANLRDAKVTDYYTLNGKGVEKWSPVFVYHGFRYVEITGYPGIPEKDDFLGMVVYDDIPISGTFSSSNEILNQIYKNAFWSINGNYKGMPVDCPQRNERQPWLGDRAVGSHGESYIFDNSRLYAKWLDDIMYSQKADGSISDVAPPYFRYYSDNMTWPGTYLMITDMLYKQFGDIYSLRKHYPYMKKWIVYMTERYMKDDILTKDSYGDWCSPPLSIEAGRGLSANVKRPSALISTAYYFHFMKLMQEFAVLTDNLDDITYYQEQSDKVYTAFNNTFLSSDSSYYGINSLTDNLLAYSFKLVPEEINSQILDRIEEIIVDENNGHLSSGIIGIQWIMRTLARNGLEDLAFRIATETTFPSWGHMIENDATTIWELWNGMTAAPDMNSQNHVMLLGDLIIWYYEDLAGIRSHPDYPGFKKIIMDPCFPEGLDSVSASYNSIHGTIASSWTKTEDELDWQITIPPNTTAEVHFPVDKAENITEDGMELSDINGVLHKETEKNNSIITIGSGQYKFKAKF